jgi:wobble nucleotide-excising tRNase
MAEYDEDGNRLPAFLSMRDSAVRVHRSRRTIRRWMAQGMEFHWHEGRKFVLEEVLTTTYRQKIQAKRENQFQKKI